MKEKIGRLHVLTDTELQSRYSHAQLAKMAIAGGADTIQFRQKTGSTRVMIESAVSMRHLCAASGVVFVVNDRIDVALAAEADGVHLGQDDFPVPLARKILGDKTIIGGSAATLEEAQKCAAEGADYIGFGPVFPTSSKTDAGSVSGVEILKRVVREFSLPIIAIGGISAANVPEVIRAGAHGIAVISAVCCQENPERAVRELVDALQKGMRRGNHG
jgi:thiamine-phosphate pyrophosphorylase